MDEKPEEQPEEKPSSKKRSRHLLHHEIVHHRKVLDEKPNKFRRKNLPLNDQQVIIPVGLVDSREDFSLVIPAHLAHEKVVVLRKSGDEFRVEALGAEEAAQLLDSAKYPVQDRSKKATAVDPSWTVFHNSRTRRRASAPDDRAAC